jgi:hypothetical protein
VEKKKRDGKKLSSHDRNNIMRRTYTTPYIYIFLYIMDRAWKITSFFADMLPIPIGVVRSMSPPSISQMLSPEKPLVIVVSPVFDL